MYVVEDRGGAIALMLASLVFVGTFPVLLTLLERRGRLPQHTYLDYSVTNLLAGVIIAITFGQIGESKADMPNFFTQLTQDNWPSILFAMAGGIVLSLGNLVSQYAWAFVGLSVTNIICSSLTVVVGTSMNYFLDDRINKAEILFPGVACFLIAAFLGSAVYSSNAGDNEKKLSSVSHKNIITRTDADTELSSDIAERGELRNWEDEGPCDSDSTEAGTPGFLIQVEKRRSIKVEGSSRLLGLGLVFFAGLCFALFAPAINVATNDQWHTLRRGVPRLVVYTAFFYFSISCFVVGVGLNIWFLYRPMAGVPASSFGAYLKDWNGRQWALLSGLLCGFGNGLHFMGGQAAGYAAADAVQAFPLVSTFWGVVLSVSTGSRRGRHTCCSPPCCPCSSPQWWFSWLPQGIGRNPDANEFSRLFLSIVIDGGIYSSQSIRLSFISFRYYWSRSEPIM